MKTKRKMIFYEVNPRFFKDENGDGVGDLLGIISKYDYFYHLGVEAIILQDIASKEEQKNRIPFCGIEPVVGTKEELVIITNLAKNYHQKIIVEIDLGFLYKKYHWFKDHSKYSKINSKIMESNNDETRETTKLSSLKSFLPSKELIKKWKNELAIKNLLKILRFWYQLGVSGFVFENFEHLTDETELEVVSNETLFELRKIYHLTKEIDTNLIIVGRSKKVNFEDGEKYANINSKVFDYFMSLKISWLGISEKFKLDAPSDFSPRLYSMLLNETYLKCNDNIVAFNSKIIGKALSRWANDGEYLEESAKALALLLFLNGASPLIYSGDEIGLPNIGLTKHSDFKTPNFEERKLIALRENLAEKDFYKAQIMNSPLNAKSLMHWNDSKNAGFSTASKTISPLSKAIENVNVKIQYQEQTSVLNFYRKLIQLVCNSSFSNLINNGNLRATKLSSSFIKYEILNDDNKLFIIINFSNVSKINFFRNRGEKVIFSTYSNRDYQKIPRLFEPYEGIVLAYSIPKYVKTTKQIEIEKLRKSKIEKKAREKAKLAASLKQKQALEAAKKAQEKMIDNKIKAAQAEEKEILFKRYKNKQFKDDLEQEKQMEAAKKRKQEAKEAPKKSFDPFATNDLELEELKKSTQIDWKADKSHLDEATKLKEEELAKTILLDDDVDLDKLFETEKNKKK